MISAEQLAYGFPLMFMFWRRSVSRTSLEVRHHCLRTSSSWAGVSERLSRAGISETFSRAGVSEVSWSLPSALAREGQRGAPCRQVDIWILLIAGLLVSIALAFFWDTQVTVWKGPVSIGLLVLTFLSGAVCSSTGVVFYPYVAPFKSAYTSCKSTRTRPLPLPRQ
jgi:hypothetical protein